MSNRKIHCNQNKMWTTKDASGIAIIVRSRKHTTISQNLIGDLVANITVAVSEKKIICTMDTRTTNALAFTHTVMPLPIMTNTGRNISAISIAAAFAANIGSGIHNNFVNG